MLVEATSADPGPPAEIEAIKPPRLNVAGICLRCDERHCHAPDCIAWHAGSSWMVCPDCDGHCWTEDVRPCGCVFGVVEAAPSLGPALLTAL
jgi:hypothetical protein